MQQKKHQLFFSKTLAVFLMVPIVLATSMTFPRPAHAFIFFTAFFDPLLGAVIGLVVFDAVSCNFNVIWGCKAATATEVATFAQMPPTATLTASPVTIDSGESSTLTWSSQYTTSCTAAGGFNTGGATAGSASTGVLTSTQNYQVTCTGAGGNATANATVNVIVPNIIINASRDRVRSGDSITISWDVSDVNSCSIYKNGSSTAWQTFTTTGASRTASGSATDIVNSQTIYTITCRNNAGAGSPISVSKIVNVVSAFQEF